MHKPKNIGGSNANTKTRDSEIEDLRKRLRDLESRDQPSNRNNVPRNQTHEQQQKNLTTAQNLNRGGKTELVAMKTYLSKVMQTIQEFDQQLSEQLNTDSIPLERL